MDKLAPTRQLSLLDSTCLTIGIIIGAGVYQMAPAIARGASTSSAVLGLWVLGGLISLCGALTYAELATTFPEEGGDYVYLKKAFGDWAGFLFGWIQMMIVRPGDIAIMAFVFANYGRTLIPAHLYSDGQSLEVALGAGVVIVTTAINMVGVQQAKWIQNILTLIKCLGVLLIVGLAFYSSGTPYAGPNEVESIPPQLALVFVLFTFGGWNEVAYVSAEVRDPSKNISRALFLGVGTVTLLYLLLNGAFLHALGYHGLANSQAPATDAVAPVLGPTAANLVSLLVCLSALGAVHGLIFAGARISFALGNDHSILRWVSHWNPSSQTPQRALLLQAAICVALILTLGTYIDAIIYTAAAVYSFQLATALSLYVLRRRLPGQSRPYKAAGYPLSTAVFCLACLLLFVSAVRYKPLVAGTSLLFILTGLPVYALSKRLKR